MKILLNLEIEDRHVALIRAVSDRVVPVQAGSREEVLKLMPEMEAVFGGLSRDMFRRAEKLRWVQSWGAGVDGCSSPSSSTAA